METYGEKRRIRIKSLLHWHSRTGNPELTFLVHGEEKSMKTLRGLLENTRVEMPELH